MRADREHVRALAAALGGLAARLTERTWGLIGLHHAGRVDHRTLDQSWSRVGALMTAASARLEAEQQSRMGDGRRSVGGYYVQRLDNRPITRGGQPTDPTRVSGSGSSGVTVTH